MTPDRFIFLIKNLDHEHRSEGFRLRQQRLVESERIVRQHDSGQYIIPMHLGMDFFQNASGNNPLPHPCGDEAFVSLMRSEADEWPEERVLVHGIARCVAGKRSREALQKGIRHPPMNKDARGGIAALAGSETHAVGHGRGSEIEICVC